ncbi:hypothetical protein ARALYDRAFT_901858 [Arabidopsis lyrata subsp. lyrata]|uniref:Uncharacterized protein n=1 Tax=Arabidopsis lyrata subsp. lyrata TaxID=81972 RepID=D7LKB1_ARALL|nr:hypothetical protein ARALYDRAFT_901858 [Arabidopsis lyrata subsp. lyrata]
MYDSIIPCVNLTNFLIPLLSTYMAVAAMMNIQTAYGLDLRSKGLSGTIVPALQYLTELQRLNLCWNKLNASVPQALHDREKKGLQLMIKGNPKLCTDDRCKFKNKKILVPVVASVARLVLIIPLLVLIFMCTKKNMRKARNQQPIKSPILTTKIRFTNPKLQAMTNNFGRVIGEGGFRTVYHGFSRSIWKVLELAVSCVIPSSAGRPNMSHADNQLDECLLYENSKNLERFKDFY